jgi:NAD(P)-dependent dehydrogenase (short-subunit alcohol dehydrogenase family)
MKILITGANTGIGFATAEQLVKKDNMSFWLVVTSKGTSCTEKLRALDQGQVDLFHLI